MEREAMLESVRKDIAHKIVEMCVNSNDQSNFPLSIILKVMGECKVKINEKKPAKKQALEIVGQLREHGLPIKRARMRVAIQMASQEQMKYMQELLEKHFADEYTIERVDEQSMRIQAAIEPHLYRDISEIFDKGDQAEAADEDDVGAAAQQQEKKKGAKAGKKKKGQ